jgi:hypothetical protein
MWESGALVFRRISKPGGKSGKLALPFEFSTLSRGRHFHGALPRVVLGAQRRGPGDRCRLASLRFRRPFFRSPSKSDRCSQKACAKIA